MNRGQPISQTVIETIAEHEGTPCAELTPPLHYAVDLEALDSLAQSAGSDRDRLSVEFSYQGYTVRVRGDGEVTIGDSDPVAQAEREAA
ncbi:HalOD1 output domain-containing protein [Halosolutus gelatinilyticus]|uniref:HalOD1 output domain-containing protein n=1 Tax=Halosolutus gelatinilyticus TaxID=2931975 RepID=UPI001FF2EE8C|nr:HalOD1 output domain-containing protein [Halosolutus gelatinilyticus]